MFSFYYISSCYFHPFLIVAPFSIGNGTVYNYITAAGEVGSGTPNAAAGRHFSNLSPKGHAQEINGSLTGILSKIEVISFKPRGKDGFVDFQEEKLIVDIKLKLSKKKNIVILHIVCGSKTGLVYPSLKTVKSLKKEFNDRIVVVVDACQLRCRVNAVSEYLRM